MSILSMTGFGSAKVETPQAYIEVEVKSLNAKFLELSLRLPKQYSALEHELRNQASTAIDRGKATINVERIAKPGEGLLEVNTQVFRQTYSALLSLAHSVNADERDLFRLAIQMAQEQRQEQNPEQKEIEQQAVKHALAQALMQFEAFRKQEGINLCQKLSGYAEGIRHRLAYVVDQEPARIKATRERLLSKLNDLAADLQTNVDHNRFEQELIYYIEKLDITEEVVRLRNHLDYFQQSLNEGNGKKLGFISQEMGREINTIGSKVNDAILQRTVVEMKDELEKIKEQSLNLL